MQEISDVMRKKTSIYSSKFSATLNMYSDDKIKSMPCVMNIDTVIELHRWLRVETCDDVMPRSAEYFLRSSNTSISSELTF